MPTAERLRAQLLAGEPARDVLGVVERLLAVQAQDQRGARLAVRSRSRGLTAADVDRALAERTVLVTWLNRGTLHLVRREDYPWLQALTAPTTITANLRRLEQEGVSPRDARRGVQEVCRALGADGPLTRDQLRERLQAIGVPTARQALVHVLMRASLLGHVVRGPMAGAEQAFVLVSDWLGEQPVVAREVALAELARRYLRGHGPADDRDLAKWAGLPLRDARAGLGAIGASLRRREDGLVQLAGHVAASRARAAPKLLGAFDPLLLGWRSREPILGDHTGVVTVNGLFRPIALVGGRAVATWRLAGGVVTLEPWSELRAADAAALRRDGEAVKRFLGV